MADRRSWMGCALLAVSLAIPLAACNQTDASTELGMAVSLDPTGLAQRALVKSQNETPSAAAQAQQNLSRIAPRLTDVAAGNTARPNSGTAMDAQIGRMAADEAMGVATTAASLALNGSLASGAGLVAAAPGLAMQAVSTGVATAGLASEGTQFKATMARIEAQKAARRIVPDEDRPAEARAVLSILDGPDGRSATWQNPQTGASGTVTIRSRGRVSPSGLNCRLVQQEWRGRGQRRKGSMAVCEAGGEWYDMS